MTGPHLGEGLSAYLDGELLPAEQASVVAHLEACAACRDELLEIDAARTALRSLPVHDPPLLLGTGRPPAAGGARRRRVASRPAAWVAATAAAVVLAVGGVGMARSGSGDDAVEIGQMIDRHNVRVSADLGLPAVQVVQVVGP